MRQHAKPADTARLRWRGISLIGADIRTSAATTRGGAIDKSVEAVTAVTAADQGILAVLVMAVSRVEELELTFRQTVHVTHDHQANEDFRKAMVLVKTVASREIEASVMTDGLVKIVDQDLLARATRTWKRSASKWATCIR